MAVKINSFGGYFIWIFRKYFSGFTSCIMLSFVEKSRKKKIDRYIDEFLEREQIPIFKFLMVETINRCNGKCAFCPANVRDEKRELKKMSAEMFEDIVRQLKEMQWKGDFFLQVNNEPLIDNRIFAFAGLVRKELPQCRICIITNGTLLDCEKLEKLAPVTDEIVINDYSTKYRLSKNIKEIFLYVKNNKQAFVHLDIKINRRYSEEILATRAGNAPNKPKKNNRVNAPCIYPFTDFIIFPDGKVGMCCNDCMETTEMGNVATQSLSDIWRGKKFNALRTAMRNGRSNYYFCKQCDVVDAGSREQAIRE